MRMRKVAPGVQKSLYPLDYNLSNPMEGFNQWAEYIKEQNKQAQYNYPLIITIDLSLAEQVSDHKAMHSLLNQAKQIINDKNQKS